MKQIVIIGSGYVGLVTGTCLAENGNQVICVDTDKNKIEKLSKGEITIFEPGLDRYFLRNIKERRLHFTVSIEEGIAQADIVFLALPTPPNEDGSADLNYVLSVANKLGTLLKKYVVVVNKSTVPVGTAEKVLCEIRKNYQGEVDVVSNPEFLREGFAVEDFMKPERVVIGTQSQKAKDILTELYQPFIRQGNPIFYMDEVSAELTKYAANAFLATKISFINEIANICEKVGANVDLVRKGMGSDSRIGNRFLYPGIGYGGSCFPKDVKALVHIAKQQQYQFEILEAVEHINEKQRDILFKRICLWFKQQIEGKVFAIWGLSFKPNTDDIRESPALHLIRQLVAKNARVVAYDPEAIENTKKVFSNNPLVQFTSLSYDALREADALIICTEWNEFRTPDFNYIGKLLKNSLIFDGRNLYDPNQMRKNGFEYYSIGR